MRLKGMKLRLAVALFAAVLVTGCTDSARLDDLENQLAEAQAALRSTTTTTTMPTTTSSTLLVHLEPHELIWCETHPYEVLIALQVLELIQPEYFEAAMSNPFVDWDSTDVDMVEKANDVLDQWGPVKGSWMRNEGCRAAFLSR